MMLQQRFSLVTFCWTALVMRHGGGASSECEMGQDGICLQSEEAAEETAPQVADDKGCVDTHEMCRDWTKMGECQSNPLFMLFSCQKSCETCGLTQEELQAASFRALALQDVGGDETLIETPYGMRQEVLNAELQEEIHAIIQKYARYMEEEVFVKEEFAAVKKMCKNRHRECAYWTQQGSCETNPAFMHAECTPACQSCHMLDHRHRCPHDLSVPHALTQPGDLNSMFLRILSDHQQYQPKILAMPNPTEEQIKEEGIVDGPWVIELDQLLTDHECGRLIELGKKSGYQPSTGLGKPRLDGFYDNISISGRTSANTWCVDDCMNNEVPKKVEAKIASVLGIPTPNSEYLQLLQYDVGQFYESHHDFIDHHLDRQQGVRILTVFLYLNDVEAGGGTNFSKLGITVLPKKGKALIWPSVLDEEPDVKDERTWHGALPVEKGRKYAANAWIHQRDFREVLARGCI